MWVVASTVIEMAGMITPAKKVNRLDPGGMAVLAGPAALLPSCPPVCQRNVAVTLQYKVICRNEKWAAVLCG